MTARTRITPVEHRLLYAAADGERTSPELALSDERIPCTLVAHIPTSSSEQVALQIRGERGIWQPKLDEAGDAVTLTESTPQYVIREPGYYRVTGTFSGSYLVDPEGNPVPDPTTGGFVLSPESAHEGVDVTAYF